MVFLSMLSRKKNVPEELPDLVIDEIKDKLKDNSKNSEGSPKLVQQKIEASKPELRVINNEKKEDKHIIDKDKSFFNKLLTDINVEINDVVKLEGWYNNKFINNDIVTDMKDYWEDKKHELVIKSIGKGFKEKISVKIESLQVLEGEWQDIYLKLIEKEEELKNEEKELKKIVSEFMEMCKRRGNIKDEVTLEKKD